MNIRLGVISGKSLGILYQHITVASFCVLQRGVLRSLCLSASHRATWNDLWFLWLASVCHGHVLCELALQERNGSGKPLNMDGWMNLAQAV